MRKLLIVYEGYNSPPFDVYRTAKEMAKQSQVIFFDLVDKPSSLENIFNSALFFIKGIFDKEDRFFSWRILPLVPLKRFKLFFKMNKIVNRYLIFIYFFLKKILFDKKVILITIFCEPHSLHKFIPYDLSFFDCHDQIYKRQFQKNKKTISQFTGVFTNTQMIFDEIILINPHVYKISSGYFLNLPIGKKRLQVSNSVVFVGGISNRIDYNLLIYTIKKLPQVNFFFIGEVYLLKYYIGKNDLKCLKKWQNIVDFPNVCYFGDVSQQILYKILPIFQVGIIPYDSKTFFNYCSHPIKMYEYLACQLPIVSTNIPAVTQYSRDYPIYVTDKKEEFTKYVISFLRQQKGIFFDKEKLKKLIKNNSISIKIKQIYKIINYGVI